jgi:hypothetical protein
VFKLRGCGDPGPGRSFALALTSDSAASELWVGENAGSAIGAIDTASDTLESTTALGTAYAPTGIVIVG